MNLSEIKLGDGVTLGDFCPETDPRDWILEPFAQDGYLWATNGKILVRIRIPKDCEYEEIEPGQGSSTPPKMSDIIKIPETDDLEWLPFPMYDGLTKTIDCFYCECPCCKGSDYIDYECPECGQEVERVCHRCDGDGHGGLDPDCETCKGTGKITAPADQIISGFKIAGDLCILISKLSDIEYTPNLTIGKSVFFRFDGGIGLAWLMR